MGCALGVSIDRRLASMNECPIYTQRATPLRVFGTKNARLILPRVGDSIPLRNGEEVIAKAPKWGVAFSNISAKEAKSS